MVHVERFRRAEEDLLAIAQYIAKDNATAAIAWLGKIDETLALLAEQPEMGEAVDHIRPGLRRISHGDYLLFYETQKAGIGLVRVIHGARRIEDLMD